MLRIRILVYVQEKFYNFQRIHRKQFEEKIFDKESFSSRIFIGHTLFSFTYRKKCFTFFVFFFFISFFIKSFFFFSSLSIFTFQLNSVHIRNSQQDMHSCYSINVQKMDKELYILDISALYITSIELIFTIVLTIIVIHLLL